MKIGITGAAGLIGTILLNDDFFKNHEITAYDKIKRQSSEVKQIKVDFSEEKPTEGIFRGLDMVIHLAAESHEDSGWENVLRDNIIATHNVFHEAANSKVRRIIFASSNHLQHGYAMKENKPSVTDPKFYEKERLIRVGDEHYPDSLYGVSKGFGEDLGWFFSRTCGVEFVGLRIGAVLLEDNLRNLPDENQDYLKAMYLSNKDCARLFKNAVNVDLKGKQPKYLIAYGVGNNPTRIFDSDETNRAIGFFPEDGK